MGLFDSLTGALGQGGGGLFGSLLGGPLAGALAGNLPERLSGILATSPYGDINGLLERFREAGLGPQVDSWLSAGANLPLSTEEIMAAIDPDTMSALATAIGLPAQMLPNLMAQYLPLVVDKLSPAGVLELPQR
ncbi:MAG: hypothetical protein B7Z15_07260 [Rhizobiales bacterium 32-66-8]|nr:MAG: hypothetical protein B7Z45_09970 [Azorhizobium sp. 12-66-6]OYX13430.1 MAG: hypothetical protein B7Z15_07260 [Rhizobiales bacterium 32-66-8]